VKVVLVIIATVLALYLLWFGSLNPQRLSLPLLISLPAVVVVLAALIVGFALGWLLAQPRVWRLRRENGQLVSRLQALGELPAEISRPLDPAEPVIPDRDMALERRERQ
jgi:uncharacterized integral membrane protein